MLSVLIKNKVGCALFTFVPVFGMFSLNFVASELENPFGDDDNDLPLAHFQQEMNTSLLMLLHYNTDHIAELSDKCIKDFTALKESTWLHDDPGREDGKPTMDRLSALDISASTTGGEDSDAMGEAQRSSAR